MTLRTLVVAAACWAVAGQGGWVGSARAAELTVVSRGGVLRAAQQQAYLAPFTAATGLAVHDEGWDGGIGVLRGKAESGSNAWDVVEVEGDALQIGCAEGLFEKLDWARIGGKDRILPAGVSDCGLGAAQYDIVLAWDRDKFGGTPSWADFWDVAKFPGRRGLRRGVRTNLEIALLADGVAPGDVYRLLRTDDGVDRAFRKLDQLKPYVAWWDTGGRAPQMLGSGEVLMTSAPNSLVTAANRTDHRNFGIQWANGLGAVDSWAILHNSPQADGAYRFLDFVADPQGQAQLATLVAVGGLARGSNDALPPDALAASPANPDNAKQVLPIDEEFWRDNLDKLSQRFNAWLAH